MDSVASIPRVVSEAFRRMRTRPLPVVLEVAYDVLEDKEDVESLPSAPAQPQPGAVKEVEWAGRLLNDSARPVIWAGGGVISSSADRMR